MDHIKLVACQVSLVITSNTLGEAIQVHAVYGVCCWKPKHSQKALVINKNLLNFKKSSRDLLWHHTTVGIRGSIV